jgi:hypothetical protein
VIVLADMTCSLESTLGPFDFMIKGGGGLGPGGLGCLGCLARAGRGCGWSRSTSMKRVGRAFMLVH